MLPSPVLPAEPTAVSSPAPALPARRYHALDHLRAWMMLLGVVLHAAMSYSTRWFGSNRFVDAHTSVLLDVPMLVIHLFRMPLFFLVSGFLGALLLARRGGRSFVRNRAKRIAVPLLVAWPLLFPLTGLGYVFALQGADREALRIGWAVMTSGAPVKYASFSLMHLWFLEYLLVYYALALVVRALWRRLPGHVQDGARRTFAAHAVQPLGLVVGAALSTLTLLPMQHIGLDDASLLIPPFHLLAAYGLFFAFGWGLYHVRGQLTALVGAAGRYLALAGLATLACVLLVLGTSAPVPRWAHDTGAFTAAVAMWALSFGLLGAALRHADVPSPLGRYLSDASYWVYLFHLPLTVWLQGLLLPLPWPALVKFAVVLVGTAAVSLGTYHTFVRSTWLGQGLNGRRYPRRLLPVSSPEPEPVG